VLSMGSMFSRIQLRSSSRRILIVLFFLSASRSIELSVIFRLISGATAINVERIKDLLLVVTITVLQITGCVCLMFRFAYHSYEDSERTFFARRRKVILYKNSLIIYH